jgi:flagellar motility protein MotE (MotC chaperone)
MTALLGQRDEAQKAQIASLVKTYSTMKAKDSARIFNSLPDDVLVPVAQQMKSDVLALILANMNSDNAKALTVKLANKLTLPQTADAVAPPAITPVSGAAAAPMQTAATAPAPAKPTEKAAEPKT